MKVRSSGRDPFAGYTPVKVSVPVADLPEQPAKRRGGGKKYKFGKNAESGDLARTVKLAVILVVSAVLVLVIAAFSFGVIYDKPVRQAVPELADYADDIKPLADAGRGVRHTVLDAVAGIASSFDSQPSEKSSGAATQTTNFVASVAKGIKRVSGHKENVKSAQSVVDNPEESLAPVSDPEEEEDGNDRPVVYGVNDQSRREIDPRLKKFYGGRSGRSMGDWRRKTK